jgi:plasmid stabilization system protein ParE
VVTGIYDKAQLLSDLPQLGYKYREEPEGDIRILLYGHYRIAYMITEDFIGILGVFHGALEIEKYLL